MFETLKKHYDLVTVVSNLFYRVSSIFVSNSKLAVLEIHVGTIFISYKKMSALLVLNNFTDERLISVLN